MVIRLKVWPVDVLFDRKKQHKITPRIRYLFYMELILINMKESIYRSQGEKASHYHAFFFLLRWKCTKSSISKVTSEGLQSMLTRKPFQIFQS